MAAYVIVDLEVTDPSGYEDYRQAVGPTIATFGGRTMIRTGEVEILEGDWRPTLLVVLEFAFVSDARRWYESEEYQPVKTLRLKSSRANMVVVEGT